MKQTEKQTQKSKKTQQLERSPFTVEKTPNRNSTGLNEQGEELIQREDVENTPFQVITINKESFGVFGKYRITEMYHTKQQCKAELQVINWNRLIQIMTLVHNMMTENKNTKTK